MNISDFKINMNKHTCLSMLSYSSLFYDQIRMIAFIHDNSSYFSLSKRESEFIDIFMQGFMINSFDDFSNPEHSWRLNLYKTNDLYAIYEGFSSIVYKHKRDEKEFDFFQNTLTFQIALLNILNIRPSFSFTKENLQNSYVDFEQLSKSFTNQKKNTEKPSFIKNILHKFMKNINYISNQSKHEYFASFNLLHKLVKDIKTQSSSSFLVISNLSAKYPEHNLIKLAFESDKYIAAYNDHVRKTIDKKLVYKLNDWISELDTSSPCVQNLFFTITSLTINEETSSKFKFFLNDYFLSDFTHNKEKKCAFLTNFYTDLYFSYINKETSNNKPIIPFKMVLEKFYNKSFDNDFINDNKKHMCYLLDNSDIAISPFNPINLFSQLERQQNLLSKLSIKEDIIYKKKKI